MANDCYFEMKLVGSLDSCNKWIAKMKSYDEECHFYRIHDIEVYSCEEVHRGNSPVYAVKLCGSCAWSLESCCRASGYSGGIDLFSVNTHALNLVMEAFSSEPGMGFQEHFVYDRGKCITNECVDWHEVTYDPDEWDSFEDFCIEMGFTNIVQESDTNEYEYISVGGFPNWEFGI